MRIRFFRLFVVVAMLFLAAAADRAASAAARCVIENGLTYCCWGKGMCRVCDTFNCYIVAGSDCPQNCPS